MRRALTCDAQAAVPGGVSVRAGDGAVSRHVILKKIYYNH
jgi:hypothetical protein